MDALQLLAKKIHTSFKYADINNLEFSLYLLQSTTRSPFAEADDLDLVLSNNFAQQPKKI